MLLHWFYANCGRQTGNTFGGELMNYEEIEKLIDETNGQSHYWLDRHLNDLKDFRAFAEFNKAEGELIAYYKVLEAMRKAEIKAIREGSHEGHI